MGRLTLPASGPVYVDTNTIIYRVERVQPYFDTAMPLWDALDAGTVEVVTSELSVLEVLVKPLRTGNTTLQALFQAILYNTQNLSCVPITRQTLEEAARIRAMIGIRTPDAIHAATALATQCTLFVTNDPGFRRVPHLPVVFLSEVAAAP